MKKWLERSSIWLPWWGIWWRMLILTNQLHFLTTFIWDALNVHANRTNSLLMNTEKCLNNEFLLEQLKNYHGGQILTRRRLRGPTTWKDTLKNALKDIANRWTKRQSSFAKSQVLAWMITIARKRNLNQLENLSKVWWQIVLKCSYLARSGGPDILWPVNKLARSVTKWTGACDRILACLISYSHHTSGYWQYCHVGNTAQHCRLGLFEDSHLAGYLWGLKINLVWNLVYFRKSNPCFQKLDVQETNVSIQQFYRTRNDFVGCWTANAWISCLWLMRCGDRSVTFIEQHQNTNSHRNRKLLAKSQIQIRTKGKPKCWSIVACGLRHHKRKFFSGRVSVVHLWR